MNYLSDLARGYHMPDFSRIFSEVPDRIDGRVEEETKPFFDKLEPYLIRLQELALWTDPTSSALALVVFHVLFWFLQWWFSSPLYTIAWIGIIGFVYTTWINRIWPVIRVEEPDEDQMEQEVFTPLNPACMSGPELRRRLCQIWVMLKSWIRYMKELRKHNHAKFFAISFSFFIYLAVLGMFVSARGLVYYGILLGLTLPGILRNFLHYPDFQRLLDKILVTSQEDQVDGTGFDLRREIEGEASFLTGIQRRISETVQQGSTYLAESIPSSESLNISQDPREGSSPSPDVIKSETMAKVQAYGLTVTKEMQSGNDIAIEEVSEIFKKATMQNHQSMEIDETDIIGLDQNPTVIPSSRSEKKGVESSSSSTSRDEEFEMISEGEIGNDNSN